MARIESKHSVVTDTNSLKKQATIGCLPDRIADSNEVNNTVIGAEDFKTIMKEVSHSLTQ